MKFSCKFEVGVLLCVLAALPVLAQTAGERSSAAETAMDAAMLVQLDKVRADPSLNATAMKRGAKLADFCANCHGANGNSTYPDTPNLASQNVHYLLVQMLKFADGRRRKEFKERLIRAMSESERISMALYYARQPITTQVTPANRPLLAQGKLYYEKVCFRCHGADGNGTETYARLAGQQESYVTLTLHRYREDTGERMSPEMASSAKLMDDATIRAVAAYIASMP
ncbi:MAG: c-type cytochrome [Burkholderiaceae bacterium]|jgi:cytochrome c553|nr:c-type cytochrome [Burkholderiaceae bacterium]